MIVHYFTIKPMFTIKHVVFTEIFVCLHPKVSVTRTNGPSIGHIFLKRKPALLFFECFNEMVNLLKYIFTIMTNNPPIKMLPLAFE